MAYANFFDLLKWLVAFASLTPVGGLVLALCFGGLRRSDYLIAKFVGLIVVSGVLWICGYLRVPVLDPLALELGLGSLAIGSLWGLQRLDVSIDHRAWAKSEAAFALLLVAFVVVRGFFPTVLDGEKPMDMMLLSSSIRARTLPPEDAWMAGRTLNYYYFGFFAFGSLAKAARLSSFFAFSMGIGSIWSGSLILLLYLGKSLMGSWRKAIAFPLLYGFVANLGALLQLLRTPQAVGWEFDWWAPSRAVTGAITEFPAFSYLFGEFHSHMMATIWLGTIVVVLHRAVTAETSVSRVGPVTLGILFGLAAGELYVTNSWSIVALAALGLGTFSIWSPRPLTLVAAVAAALAIVLPYSLTSHPASVNLVYTQIRTPLSEWATHWLILVSAVAWGFLVRPLNRFVVILVVAGSILILLPEVMFFQAVYDDRLNTVFKLWWDAWFLMSVAGAYGLVRLSEVGGVSNGVAIAHFAAGGLYLPLGLPPRYGFFGRWYGIDSEPFVFAREPSLEAPYRQLMREAPKAFYEPSGESYSGSCLLSAFTGVPTYLGWKWHETVWRDHDPDVRARIESLGHIRGPQIPLPLERSFRFQYAFYDGQLLKLNSQEGASR